MMVAFRYISSPSYALQMEKHDMLLPLSLCVFLIFWLGFRPISGTYFGDTANYALEYSMLDTQNAMGINWKSEWLWALTMLLCKSTGFSVSIFFTLVEAGYILFAFWAAKRFLPSNPLIGTLFVFSSLMFYNFGVNGLRNGVACSIILVAFSYFLDNKYWFALVLAIVALGFHRSVFLPIVAIIVSRYFIKDFKLSVYFWMACIFISLIVGGSIANFFASLGFDDRMNSYLSNDYEDSFSSIGFRWDFLLYSTPPIVLGWYILVHKKIKDDWFRILCMTYVICNAFWVLVIRVAFTNRFAYLSWFMYPILIAYPIINLPIWKDQDKKIGMILACYCGFTLFMQLIIW